MKTAWRGCVDAASVRVFKQAGRGHAAADRLRQAGASRPAAADEGICRHHRDRHAGAEALRLSAITTARELCPDVLVLADTKTVDGGQLEADMVFGAGAAFMTVLSCASPATHETVGDRATAFGATVIVDTITESGKAELLPRVSRFRKASAMSRSIRRPMRGWPATRRPPISTRSGRCTIAASGSRSPAASARRRWTR